VREREEEHRGDDEARDGDEDAAVEAEAERDHEEGGDQRPEGEADVPADGEE
jgi:hypothetical protein